jgi:tRNA nucleotidyltransferase (CCA-adding enzyme)
MQVRCERHLADTVTHLATLVAEAGGRALLVGGCVRDGVLGIESKDLDIEVYGLAPEALESLLAAHFPIDRVGKAFGVLKLHGTAIDVAIPRREAKAGLGHRGFEIMSDPWMTPAEAAARRDFTINAMAGDPLTGEVIDPFGGQADLHARVLRHTSAAFADDPLRVLRGMQFCARFELTAHPDTVALCAGLDMEGLSRERVFEEWRKLLLRGVRPSLGLTFLRETGWVRFFPEPAAMIGCPQDAEWHPEGDVWVHTLHCLDAFAAERMGDEWEDLVVGMGVLCHDLGKPATTTHDPDGRIRSRGHEEVGEGPTRAYLARLTNQEDLAEQVVPLVVHHLRPGELFRAKVVASAVRRLASKVGRIDRLVRVARADKAGRPPIPFTGHPAGDWLLEQAKGLEVHESGPRAIVMGRHLIALGLRPGPHFRTILDRCFEAQIEGEFTTEEGGIAYARSSVVAGQEGMPGGADPRD